jgi:hypothetical protein
MADHETNKQYLTLLSIFHFIVGGLVALFSLLPVFHLVLGLIMVLASGEEPAAAIVGFIFICVATGIILAGWAIAAAIALCGYFIIKRRYYMYCLVIAALECLFTPFGTILGVFTLVLLTQKPVKQLFNTTGNNPTPQPGD